VVFFSVFVVTVCDMYSGGVRNQTNRRLVCVGRLGIRFLFGVLGRSWFALRVHKLGRPAKIGIYLACLEWGGWME